MAVKDYILDTLFPPKCAFCGKVMDRSGDGVCPDCQKRLPRRAEDSVLQKAGNFSCAVCLYYDDMVVSGIHAMKFAGHSGRCRVFAHLMTQTAAEHLGGEFDAVTFVPVSAVRRFRRGFDQSRLLAEHMARRWDTKAEKILVKVRNNPPQSSVKTAAQRAENVKDVYRVRRGADVKGRRFLLVDDVFTTGSTMAACARTLMRAGAKQVVCVALAGGHREKG